MDEFLFNGFGCSDIYLDLDPVQRADGRIFRVSSKSDVRYTNGCFWKFLAETLNVNFLDLASPSVNDYATRTQVAVNAATEQVTQCRRERQCTATQEILELTITPEIMPPVLTRRAKSDDDAQTHTPGPTFTRLPTYVITETPATPVVQSNCQ